MNNNDLNNNQANNINNTVETIQTNQTNNINNNQNNNVNNNKYTEDILKESKKENRKTTIVIGIILVIYLIYNFILPIMDKNNSLTKMIETLPHDERVPLSLPYNTPSFYFNYKNKLYYYEHKDRKNYFYEMDLNGSNKKLISEDSLLLFPSFYLVYKDEAYFFSTEGYIYNDEKRINYKVNLNTGVVTSLENSYRFLPYLFKDGKIISVGSDEYSDPYTYRVYNLDTNESEYENTYKYDFQKSYIYDYSNGDIYSIRLKQTEDKQAYNLKIFKNDIEVGDFILNDLDNYTITLLYANNDALFFYSSKLLYKYDINTKELKATSRTLKNGFDIINSNNPNNLFIYDKDEKNLYLLDKENITLKKLFTVKGTVDYFKEIIIETKDKIIISAGGNSLKYKTNLDPLGTLNIYDKNTGKIDLTENVRRTFYDYENNIIYLYVKKGNRYYSKIVNME